MRTLLIILMLLSTSCSLGTELGDNDICGADNIEDILGTWYDTETQESNIEPGYYVTDSTIWILERIPTSGSLTSMDSLLVTKEFHPGDRAFDPTRDSQTNFRLQYEPGSSPYGTLAYGNAEFRIPECDSLIMDWVDGTTYRLKRKQ